MHMREPCDCFASLAMTDELDRLPTQRSLLMQYAPNDLKPRERYKVLTSFVLPRPIAWVTTIGPTGVVNAAPFSFFNVFCEDPPLCMFAANLRPDGRIKDTVINIRAYRRVRGQHDRRGAGAGDAREQRRLPARYRRAGLSESQTGALDEDRGAAAGRRAVFDGMQDLEGNRRQRRPAAGDGRRHPLPHPRRSMGPRRDARAHGALSPDRPHVRGSLLPDR